MLGCFVLLLLYGVGAPLVSTVVAGSIVCLVSLITGRVLRTAFGWDLDEENFPIAWVTIFGASTLVIAMVGVENTLMVTLIGVLLLALMLLLNKKLPRSSGDEHFDSNSGFILFFIAILALICQMWVFLIPLALTVLVIIGALRPMRQLKRKSRILLPAVLLISGSLASRLFGQAIGAEGLVFRSADQFWRASVAFSTIRFGGSTHPGATGSSLDYHWLSEAGMGLISYISRDSVVDVIVFVSAPLAMLLATFSSFALARVCGLTKSQGLFAAFLMTCNSMFLYSQGVNILKTTEMGQIWGTSFFLVGFVVLVKFFENPGAGSGVLLVVTNVLLFMTNSTLGLVFCGTIYVGLFLLGLRSMKWVIPITIGMLLSAIVLILNQTLLESPEKAAFSPSVGLSNAFGFSFAFGYNGTNNAVKIAVSIAFLILLWFQAGTFFPRKIRFSRDAMSSKWTLFYAALFVGVLLANLIDIGNFEQYRFLVVILILGPVLASRRIPELQAILRRAPTASFVLLIVIAVIGGIAARPILAKKFGDAETMLPRLAFVFLMVFIPVSFWAATRIFTFRRNVDRSIPIASIFLMFALTSGIVHTVRESVSQFRYASALESPRASNEQRIKCMELVRKNSDKNSRIATTMWRWSADAYSEKWYLASAVSERVAFVDGPLYVADPRPEWLQSRANLTLRFAANPSESDLKELRRWGVEWFVADKNWPVTSDWSAVGTIVMENDSCVVVKLSVS